MFLTYTRRASARRNHFTFILLYSFLLLFCSCAVVAFAQGGVGSSRGLPGTNDGIHTIKGRVYFPVDAKGDRHLRVTLRSADTTDETATTDEDGSFAFNRLRAGNYTVTVDGGKEFDDATESASIDRAASSGGRIINLQIALRVKGTAEAYSKIPKAARDLYSKGTEAAAKGDSKKAVEHLSGAVAAYPEFQQALSELGVQYLKLGQPDKAAESLQAALKIAPNDLGVRLNYGVALLNQKKFNEAEAQLREVLTKKSDMPTAHMYLGIALLSLSRDEKTKQFDAAKYDEARKELKAAVGTGKDEVAPAHRYLGGIYWGDKDYKRAADEFEIYLKLAPKAPDAEKLRAAIKDLRSKG
jgi:Tfp pilus assembly protein PilF